MKVEAAVVTQKRQNSAFNADSVNINGKLLSREVLQNGYKGTGVMNGDVYFAISSSDIEGFADAAVAAFNERSDSFKDENSNPSDIITGYFKDSVYALGEMGHRSSELASSIMYASGSTVIMAKTGATQLYAYSKNGLAKVTTALFSNDDGASQYGVSTFPTVEAGDIFLLVSPGVSQSLSDKDLDDICKASEGSVKKIVNLIAKVSAAKEGSGAISAIVVKITEAETNGAAPVYGFKSQDPSQLQDAFSVSKVENQWPEQNNRLRSASIVAKKNNKLILAVLVAAVIIVLLAIAALAMKLFGGNIGSLFSKPQETTTAAVVTTTERPSETTTNMPVTTTMPATTTTAPTTTTTAPASTAAPSSSGSSSRTTTRRYEEEDDEDEDEEEEEEYTTAEAPVEESTTAEPTTFEIPSELTPIETEPSSVTPVSPNVTTTEVDYF